MIQIRKAIPSDTDGIEKLYSDVCDHLEAHENFPGWKKGIYPAREDAENGIKYGSLFSVLENGEIIASFMLCLLYTSILTGMPTSSTTPALPMACPV